MGGRTRVHILEKQTLPNSTERSCTLALRCGGARRCVWMGKLLSLAGSANLIEETVAHAAHMASLAGAIKFDL